MRAIQVRIPAAKRVLDFGCGTGWVIAEAEMQSAYTFRVGIDLFFEQLKRARQATGLSYAASDGLRLPFAADTFDVVVGHVSMPYMDTQAALREIYRVMAPGGTLLLTFHNFRYFRERITYSFKARNIRDIAFSLYMAANGLLNHCSMPQVRCWWKPSRFETINTPEGAARSAGVQGFISVCAERTADRIFFVLTATKPNGPGLAVLPALDWTAYSESNCSAMSASSKPV